MSFYPYFVHDKSSFVSEMGSQNFIDNPNELGNRVNGSLR